MVFKGGWIMKKVITYGTFDLLHTGHINLLSRAKDLGDYLVVAISSDEFNTNKGKKAYYTFEQRKAILEAIRFVDQVIPEDTWQQKLEDVNKHHIDVFVMGDDWRGKFDFLADHCEVVYLPRTIGVSTTQIKKDLGEAYFG
jgi:glycerol-3-phosphate cytidylyltransferase